SPPARQHDPHRFHGDEKIEPEGEMLHVIEVVLEFCHGVFNSTGIPLLDLSPTGNPRLDPVAPAVEGNFLAKLPRKSHLLRPRSYQAHFTSALIVVRCELGSALLCVDSHRTKLHQTEGTAVCPTRSCQKRTGRPESIQMAAARIKHRGTVIGRLTSTANTSSTRFRDRYAAVPLNNSPTQPSLR